MNETGFIKLHRSIQSWEWFSDAVTFRVFIYLLLNAQWEDSKFKGHEIPRGSLVTSYASIASALNISVKNARTAMEHLKATGEVTSKAASKFSIVTVVNWEKYQCTEEETASKTASKTAGKWQASGNIKEIKNLRNKEYIYNRDPKAGLTDAQLYAKEHGHQSSSNPDFIDKLEKETREKSKNPYKNYIHGNYDFEQMEKELKAK